jgi:hypothetical protein
MVRLNGGGGGGVPSNHRYTYSMMPKARLLALIGSGGRGVICTAMEVGKGGL